MKMLISLIGASAALAASFAMAQQQQSGSPAPMTFFITSVGSGKGGDLGGLAGADKHCQDLAAAAGAGNRTWHAYLSTQAKGGQRAVNARDRIGKGPWFNAKGIQIAADLADLHGDTLELARKGNLINKRNAYTEKGEKVLSSDEIPVMHDILTGSQLDGRGYADAADHTCSNWTSSATDGAGQIGHTDRNAVTSISWVSAHPSHGCSQENLVSTGGGGSTYCFAIN